MNIRRHTSMHICVLSSTLR